MHLSCSVGASVCTRRCKGPAWLLWFRKGGSI